MAARRKKSKVTMVYLAQFSLSEGLELMKKFSVPTDEKFIVSGHSVMRDRARFAVWASHELSGLVCYNCKRRATHFVAERHRNENLMGYNLNVYSGNMMMTWDHIVPRACGGSNHPLNGRVACKQCNERRSHFMTLSEIAWVSQQDPEILFKPSDEELQPLIRLVRMARTLGEGEMIFRVEENIKLSAIPNSSLLFSPPLFQQFPSNPVLKPQLLERVNQTCSII